LILIALLQLIDLPEGSASLLLAPKKKCSAVPEKPQPIQRSKGGGNRLTISFAKRSI
jgi:hypothetical protein